MRKTFSCSDLYSFHKYLKTNLAMNSNKLLVLLLAAQFVFFIAPT
jgi:hypothetical protein